MKVLILLALISLDAYAIDCPPNTMQAWNNVIGVYCASKITGNQWADPYGCFASNDTNFSSSGSNIFHGSTSARTGNVPWWASSAQMYYPNVYSPGAWNYPNMQSQYYSGQGQVFAAKPNVYVESIHESKKFEFKFTLEDRLSFLATTPPLFENRTWRGKIVAKDKFEVEEAYYDYLFYDVRLPKKKMQFERGICTSRDEAIEWMLGDLKAMSYPMIAQQDFEEHWRVKIPNYPFYCLYPQYNSELDAALPISIQLEQTSFTRVLYVLVPFDKGPNIGNAHAGVPFPHKDASENRPSTKIVRENMFKEWGVAFLGTE